MSVFAVLAAVVFFLMAIHVGLGTLDMLFLALGLLALHLATGWSWAPHLGPWRGRSAP